MQGLQVMPVHQHATLDEIVVPRCNPRGTAAAGADLKPLQLRLEAHRLQQKQQEQQVTDKGLLCQRAREGLQRKIGIRKDPYSVLLALRIPIPADSQPRNVKVGSLSTDMLC